MSNPRQAAIEFTLRTIATALLRRDLTVVEAVAALRQAVGGEVPAETTPREIAAAARKAHRANVVAEIAQLEQEGKGVNAATILAHRNAADTRDPVELDTLANKYRRWCREEKRAHARLPAHERGMG